MSITGFDVSHYNSASQVASAAQSADFAFVKATEGVSIVDPSHDAHVALLRHAGVRTGHYHFAKDVTQAHAETSCFLAHANVQPGDLVALDLENMNGTWFTRASYAVTWMTTVQNATGATPFWYVNKSWNSYLHGALARWPLWIATSGDQPGAPAVAGWTIHQYSTAGGLDHDVADHDLAPYAVPYPHPAHLEFEVFLFETTLVGKPPAWYLTNGVDGFRHLTSPEYHAFVKLGVKACPVPSNLTSMKDWSTA